MTCVAYYPSPIGRIFLASDGSNLVGSWFEGQKYERLGLTEFTEQADDVLKLCKKWLDIYFSGKEPDFMPPIKVDGTEFFVSVNTLLREIPYGTATTYGALAKEVAARLGKTKMSAQAVGGAVAHNPISIFVPCHRVLGRDGSLTGYAGGVERKMFLLKLEKYNSLQNQF